MALGCSGIKELIPAETYDADIECGTIKAARTPRGKDCVTAELACGDSIVGTTEGGLSEYDDHFYSGDSFCSALPDNYSGSERAYRFAMPANAEAVIVLDSACGGDMDLIAMRWLLWLGLLRLGLLWLGLLLLGLLWLGLLLLGLLWLGLLWPGFLCLGSRAWVPMQIVINPMLCLRFL